MPRIKDIEFDVIYFLPIYPITHSNRKGKNNALRAASTHPGSPWAIGSEKKRGGLYGYSSQTWTLQDFKNLVKRARQLNLMIEFDFALQCSSHHPYFKRALSMIQNPSG